MKNTQKTFTVRLRTTNTDIMRDDIGNLINNAIVNSEYNGDLTYSVDENVQVLFNFLDDKMAFNFFITKTKEDFLLEYPYFAEEYDFCLSEFNKDRQGVLLNFLENTSTKELTEPYGLEPEDFSFCVGKFIKNNFSEQEQRDFLRLTTSKGLKVEMY